MNKNTDSTEIAMLMTFLGDPELGKLVSNDNFRKFVLDQKIIITDLLKYGFEISKNDENIDTPLLHPIVKNIDSYNEPQSISGAQKENKIILNTEPENIEKAVISTIAKISGYSESSIKPNYDLEADLGIDSAMQLELFSELGQRYKLKFNPEFLSEPEVTLTSIVTAIEKDIGMRIEG